MYSNVLNVKEMSKSLFICSYYDICWASIFSFFAATSVAKKVVQQYHEANMLLVVFSSRGFKDLTPSPLVHCWNESQWQTVCVTARACTRWWSLATWPLIRPSKPIVSVCSGFKGNTGQPGKPHSQTLEFAKGLWEAGIHLCVVKTLSGILRKHVHVNKQAGGKVPELSCSERFHLRWACIMIQIKMIRMRLMVIIR